MVSMLPALPSDSASEASRRSFSVLPEVVDVPNLIDIQLASFKWFQEEGIKELLAQISPIKDFTGNRLELEFIGYEFREPRFSELECQQRDLLQPAR